MEIRRCLSATLRFWCCFIFKLLSSLSRLDLKTGLKAACCFNWTFNDSNHWMTDQSSSSFTFGIHLKVSKANQLILNCTFFLFFFNICFLKTREVMIWSKSNIQPVLCQAGTSPLMDGLIHVRTSLTLEIRKGKFFVLRGYQHFSANPFWYVYYTTATSFHTLYQKSSWYTPRFKRRQAFVPEYSLENWFLTSRAIYITYTSTAMFGT